MPEYFCTGTSYLLGDGGHNPERATSAKGTRGHIQVKHPLQVVIPRDKIHKSRYTWRIVNLSPKEDPDVVVQNRFCTRPLRSSTPVRVAFSGVEISDWFLVEMAWRFSRKGHEL